MNFEIRVGEEAREAKDAGVALMGLASRSCRLTGPGRRLRAGAACSLANKGNRSLLLKIA